MAFQTSNEFYDSLAAGYTTVSERRNLYIQAVDALLISTLATKTSIRVLDVGTGDGQRISRIVSRLAQLGVVVDLELLEPAKMMSQLANESCPAARIYHDWSEVREGVAFDLITALWNVIGHADSNEFFREAREHLSADGLVVLDCNMRYNFAAYGWIRSVQNVVSDIVGGTRKRPVQFPIHSQGSVTHVSLRTKTGICEEAQSNGFTIQTLHFVNYETGHLERSQFSGQCVAVMCPA